MQNRAGSLFFEELPIDRTHNLLMIDIDGTLVPDDDKSVISTQVLARLQQWREANEVVLCSNSRRHERNKQIADSVGVQLLKSHYRKPSARLLSDLRPTVKIITVIGDKFLTDELFARNIKADFIAVRRKTSGGERLLVKLIYLLDNFAYFLIRWH